MTHSQAWRQLRAMMIVADVVTICLTYILADILRCTLWMRLDFPEQWPEMIEGFGSSVRMHMRVMALLPLGWPLILGLLGWYQQRWRPWRWVVKNSLAASAVLGMLLAAVALLFARDMYPRAQIGFVLILLPATTSAVRGISVLMGRWISSRQKRHVLIVGTGRDAVRIRRLLRSFALGSPVVLGHLRGPWESDQGGIETGAIIGDLDQLGPVLDEQVVDEVIFSAPLEQVSSILPSIRLCEEVGVTAHLQAESMVCHSVPEIMSFHGVPLLSYSPARHSPELLVVKRLLDITFAIIGIILTAPIMLVCAVAIKLTSPGPVLFSQRRSGLNGRVFRMHKFRTMRLGAEDQLASLAHMNESSGPVFKIKHDPRTTWFGRGLRRWSVDELPQLFNVLIGDMSIVGPRPPLPAEVEKYDRWQRRRLSMRPGLTCLWQIKGRHRIGFDEWMKLDLHYIDNWSLRLDFLILCKTVPTVFGGTGA